MLVLLLLVAGLSCLSCNIPCRRLVRFQRPQMEQQMVVSAAEGCTDAIPLPVTQRFPSTQCAHKHKDQLNLEKLLVWLFSEEPEQLPSIYGSILTAWWLDRHMLSPSSLAERDRRRSDWSFCILGTLTRAAPKSTTGETNWLMVFQPFGLTAKFLRGN